jgi:hypothetical protein
MEIKESVIRFIAWVVAGVAAGIVAIWKLSQIWTRMESALTRIEETIHGGPTMGNGMKSTLEKLLARMEKVEAEQASRKGRATDSSRKRRSA